MGPGARMLWGPGARGPYALGPGARVLWGPGPVNLTGSMEQAQLCKHPACCSTCTSDTAPPTLHCTSDTALPTALHLRHCSSKSLQSAWNPATIPQAIPRSHSTTVRQRHSKSIYIGERAEQRHEFFYYFNLGVFLLFGVSFSCKLQHFGPSLSIYMYFYCFGGVFLVFRVLLLLWGRFYDFGALFLFLGSFLLFWTVFIVFGTVFMYFERKLI